MNYQILADRLKATPYITKQNLSLLLGKTGDTLDYWVQKLTAEKTLISLKKGLYISRYYYDLIQASTPGEKELYLLYLANTIRPPSYVSLEYVLAKYGFLAESPFAITSITLKSTRDYDTPIGRFSYRNIKREFFFGYSITQFRDKQVREASFAKALFDFLYLRTFKNNKELTDYLKNTGRFNWYNFSKSDKDDFKKIVDLSQSKKMRSMLALMRKEDIIL